jgi:hypothetical protein
MPARLLGVASARSARRRAARALAVALCSGWIDKLGHTSVAPFLRTSTTIIAQYPRYHRQAAA